MFIAMFSATRATINLQDQVRDLGLKAVESKPSFTAGPAKSAASATKMSYGAVVALSRQELREAGEAKPAKRKRR